MTTPVLMVYPFQSASTGSKKSHNKHKICVMAFYIGRQHWDNPPEPTQPDQVRLTWIPAHRQFVRVFGGRPDGVEIQRQAASLHDALLANNEQIETGPHGNTFMLNGVSARVALLQHNSLRLTTISVVLYSTMLPMCVVIDVTKSFSLNSRYIV